MKILNKIMKSIALLFIIAMQFLFIPLPKAHAATSPTLVGASGYSVLGGAAVTNVGTTTTNGAVGVSPGSSITGGTINAGGGTHSNDASAIAAQADTVSVFSAIDQTCDHSYSSGQDLTLLSPLVPGVYCSAGSFLLTGNLTLTGSSGVWIFKTVSTLITSSGSSVTGGDPCNVWWRIGSAATLGTTTSFIGNIVTADVADTTALNTGATLNGRVLAQAAQTVTLAGNTISLSCAGGGGGGSGSGGSGGTTFCPNLNNVTPIIIESRRIDADSIFISWGPYSGTDKFIVQYGLTNGNWLYSTNVTGFSTTLNALPPNQPIFVRVAARNDCSVGTYGESKLVGGPALPNTGFASQNTNVPWFILAGIGVAISALLILQRKHSRFSSTH